MTDTTGMGEPTRCPQCDRQLKPDEGCPICPDADAEPEMSREAAYQAFRDHQDKYEGDADVYDPLQQVYVDACRAGELAKALGDALTEAQSFRAGNHLLHVGRFRDCPTCQAPALARAAAALAAWQGAA